MIHELVLLILLCGMIIDEIIIDKRQQKNFKIGGFVQVCKTKYAFFLN